MRIGIDASNLRDGGGTTHLTELLRHASPQQHGFDSVVVWGGRDSLSGLPDAPWLTLHYVDALNGPLPSRILWQRRELARAATAEKCDVLFAPGGSYAASFRPVVTMFRNMLPFDAREMRRYAPSYIFFRLAALRVIQARTFRAADAVIFLNEFARDVCIRDGVEPRRAPVVPHGISERFRVAPRPQRPIGEYSMEAPFRLLYTSIIDLYKHQWNVADAVLSLRREGLPVALDLVGRSYPPALRKLNAVLERYGDPNAVRVRGAVPHHELPSVYAGADGFVFASTCENMPNIMIEAMAAGLPIASSNKRPMPDILGDGGLYFDAEDPAAITAALRSLIVDPELRRKQAERSFALASAYSWERCARETFAVLAEVATRPEVAGRRPEVAGSRPEVTRR